MKQKRLSQFWTRPDVTAYVISCYQGTEGSGRKQHRAFIWEDVKSNTLFIGNTAAFTEHLAERYGVALTKWSFTIVNTILIRAGQRVRDWAKRQPGGGHTGQEPGEPIAEPFRGPKMSKEKEAKLLFSQMRLILDRLEKLHE